MCGQMLKNQIFQAASAKRGNSVTKEVVVTGGMTRPAIFLQG